MARLRRDAGNAEISIVLTGTPRASAMVWKVLTSIAAHGRGERELVITHREGPTDAAGGDEEDGEDASGDLRWPVDVRLVRCPPPDPELSHISLLTMLCDAPASDEIPQLADGLLVAVDAARQAGAQVRHVLEVVDQVLPLLECAEAGIGRQSDAVSGGMPRALVTIDGDGEALLARLAPSWREDDAFARSGGQGLPDASLLRDALRHLRTRARLRWDTRSPISEPIDPAVDLPASLVDEASRVAREAENDSAAATARADALLRLAQLYRRSGQDLAAGALRRRALREGVADTWDALPSATPPPHELERLRSWSLPAKRPAGVALIDEGRCTLVGLENEIFRIERHAAEPELVFDAHRRIHGLFAVDERRALVVARRMSLIDTHTGDVEAERDGRAILTALTRRGAERPFQAPRLRLARSLELGRVLLITPLGLHLFRLLDLELVASLQRDDILSASIVADDDVVTVHESGTVGRWTPGSGVVERITSLGTPIRDAWMASDVPLIAGLIGVQREGPRVRVTRLDDERTQLDDGSSQASSVRMSGDGRRVLSLERRLLRVRSVPEDLAQEHGEGSGDGARTLLEPPPWMPVHVDISDDARWIAVLSRTYTGRTPLRLSVWG